MRFIRELFWLCKLNSFIIYCDTMHAMKMKMGRNYHNNYNTIAKAVGIILMVLGHSGCPQVLFNLIYLFHMPLFFFCSGLFFKDISTIDKAYLFLRKRIKSLYFPFLKWSVFFLLLHNLLLYVGIYNSYYGFEGGSSFLCIKDMIIKLGFIVFTMHDYEELLGGFWFIRTLLLSSIMIIAFSLLLGNRLKSKSELMCLLFGVLTIMIRRFTPDFGIWRDMSMGTFGALFFMIGNLLFHKLCIWNKNGFTAIICCLILFFSLLYFKNEVKMECGFNKVIPYFISAISGIILVFIVSIKVDKKKGIIRSLLYNIGNHTFVILALHFLCFRFCSFFIVTIYDMDSIHVAEHPVIKDTNAFFGSFWWIIYWHVGVFVPLLINWVWRVGVNRLIRYDYGL